MENNTNNDTALSKRAFSPTSSFESLSTSDLEASSSASAVFNFPKYPSYSSYGRRSMASAALRSPRSPRRFFSFLSDHDDDGAHHFLDSCHLCKKPISSGRDIFMYRGDTPFCSEECRQEQIEMDEAQEKRIKMAQEKRIKMAQKQQQKSGKSSTSPSKSERIHVRVTGTVGAG